MRTRFDTMSLTVLPPEILCCIVAKIASQPTLCNLARCSRQLYCTIPHLYGRVSIQEVVWDGKRRIGKLRKLASLLIQRADLAVRVRQFTLHVERLRKPRVGWDEDCNDGLEAPKTVMIGVLSWPPTLRICLKNTY